MVDLVAYAKSKKDSASVAFARFLEIRAIAPDVAIAAVEGRDDVGVWKVWFVRCGLDDHIELLPCSGKKKVFELREILQRNKKNRSDNVVYLVDRDYDDWAGHAPTEDVFMTDRYSIENYFVCERVLDHALNNQFLCAGKPAEKQPVVDRFKSSFEEYRVASDETQKRTYIARRLNLRDGGSLPSKIKEIVAVSGPYQVQPLPLDKLKVESAVGVDRATLQALEDEYVSLSFLERARGKYHRAFLQFFYQSLQDERSPSNRNMFPANKPEANFKFSAINLSEWAGVSTMPQGLNEFINRNFNSEKAS
jgi:hypothetical protein